MKITYQKAKRDSKKIIVTALLLIVAQPAQSYPYPEWAVNIAESVCNHYANRVPYEEALKRAYAENYYQRREWEKYDNYVDIIFSAIKARCWDLSEEAYEIYKRQIEFDEYQRKKEERLFRSEDNLPAQVIDLSQSTIYIQYRNDKALAQALQNRLISQGANIKRNIEQHRTIKEDDIRYSNKSALPLAIKVKESIEAFYQKQGITKRLKMIDLSTRGFKTPNNQIEVWINN